MHNTRSADRAIMLCPVREQIPGPGAEPLGELAPLALSARARLRPWAALRLWASANLTLPTLMVGALNGLFHLPFWQALCVIVSASVLGALPVAFLSTLGPKTGLAQMPLSRFAFGVIGARIPAGLNALACLGWVSVNLIVGASLLATWGGGAVPEWSMILLLALVTACLARFGYGLVQRVADVAWLPLLVLFGTLLLLALPQIHLAAPAAGETPTGGALLAALATFAGVVFAHTLGWASFAADYTRSYPATTSLRRVFWTTFTGLAAPSIGLELLGVLLTALPGGANPDLTARGPGPLLVLALGNGPLLGVFAFGLGLSVLTNTVPTLYSFGISLQQALHSSRLRQGELVVLGALVSLAASLLLVERFNQYLEAFLLLIAYWVGAWCSVVLVDYGRRRGWYPVAAWATRAALPKGGSALLALAVGLGVALLGAHQALFEGPVSRLLFGADLGYPLALLAAWGVYRFLPKPAVLGKPRLATAPPAPLDARMGQASTVPVPLTQAASTHPGVTAGTGPLAEALPTPSADLPVSAGRPGPTLTLVPRLLDPPSSGHRSLRGWRICVFAGSSLGRYPEYAQTAGELGRLLAEQHIDLIYGGTNGGLMGEVADAVLAHGGRAIGVVPTGWWPDLRSAGVELIEVEDFQARKATMADLADAFMVLPGGLGTLDELSEVLTQLGLGVHRKPIGLLNVQDYFALFLALLDHMQARDFVTHDLAASLIIGHTPQNLLRQLLATLGQRASQQGVRHG